MSGQKLPFLVTMVAHLKVEISDLRLSSELLREGVIGSHILPSLTVLLDLKVHRLWAFAYQNIAPTHAPALLCFAIVSPAQKGIRSSFLSNLSPFQHISSTFLQYHRFSMQRGLHNTSSSYVAYAHFPCD